MARTARKVSDSGYYHVMLRGAGRQLLFEDDADRHAFLDMLSNQAESWNITIIAWCLMSNHVHLVICDNERKLSEFMKTLEVQYARRFNEKTGHVGHVFQERFKSVPIENDDYLLEVIRYVHNNPEKDGICPAGEYPWSSFGEYVGEAEITDTTMVLSMLDGPEHFAEFCAARSEDFHIFAGGRRIPEDEVVGVASDILHGRDPAQLKNLTLSDRNDDLRALRHGGLTVRQIERLTGIGRKTITRVTS